MPRALLAALAIALLGIVLHGFQADRLLLRHSGWTHVGRYRLIHYAKIYWTASLAILLTVPSAFAPIVVLLVVVATAVAIGPIALLAVAAFLLASNALGSKVLGASGDSSPDNQLCATLLGIAVYIFLMTFLARLPVNYRAVYLILLAIPVLIDMRGVGRRLVSWGSALVRSRPRPRLQVAAFALLVLVLGMHWLIVPQPEASADGLAMHLAISTNIALHHVFTYRPGRIFWSVMPMGADWCYTMVYLLGGEFAARLLNFVMLLLVEGLLYRAARRFVSPAIAFVILALFASTSWPPWWLAWPWRSGSLATPDKGVFSIPRPSWAGRRWPQSSAGWRMWRRPCPSRPSKFAANGDAWVPDRRSPVASPPLCCWQPRCPPTRSPGG